MSARTSTATETCNKRQIAMLMMMMRRTSSQTPGYCFTELGRHRRLSNLVVSCMATTSVPSFSCTISAPYAPCATLQRNRESLELTFFHRAVKRKPVSCQYVDDVCIETSIDFLHLRCLFHDSFLSLSGEKKSSSLRPSSSSSTSNTSLIIW